MTSENKDNLPSSDDALREIRRMDSRLKRNIYSAQHPTMAELGRSTPMSFLLHFYLPILMERFGTDLKWEIGAIVADEDKLEEAAIEIEEKFEDHRRMLETHGPSFAASGYSTTKADFIYCIELLEVPSDLMSPADPEYELDPLFWRNMKRIVERSGIE